MRSMSHGCPIHHSAPKALPLPLVGRVRGGGTPGADCLAARRSADICLSAIPPTLSLPHQGGGDDGIGAVCSAPCPAMIVGLRCATDSTSCCRHFNRTAVSVAFH